MCGLNGSVCRRFFIARASKTYALILGWRVMIFSSRLPLNAWRSENVRERHGLAICIIIYQKFIYCTYS